MKASGREADEEPRDSPRFRCPYCGAYDVARLFVATVKIDSCECCVCGARWDEEAGTGQYRGRSARSSVLLPRDR
jgi:transcription elongation factor Elf1